MGLGGLKVKDNLITIVSTYNGSKPFVIQINNTCLSISYFLLLESVAAGTAVGLFLIAGGVAGRPGAVFGGGGLAGASLDG